jgi:hypothetical protein
MAGLRWGTATSSSTNRGTTSAIGRNTIKEHVTHVLDKLGAANRTQATARTREPGLLATTQAPPCHHLPAAPVPLRRRRRRKIPPASATFE